MKIRGVSGFSQHVVAEGDKEGPAVLFVNALGTDLTVWDRVVSLLPSSWRLIRYDMRGHGDSGTPPAPYLLDDLVQDAVDVLSALNVGKCLVVGLSIGGLVGQQLALVRPNLVAGLFLSSTAPRIGTVQLWNDRIDFVRASGLRSMADDVIRRWFSTGYRAEFPREARQWTEILCRTSNEGYIGCCHVLRDTDLADRVMDVSCPIAVVGGSEDVATPPDVVIAGSRSLSASVCITIEGAGHLPCVERPDETAGLLRRFVSELPSLG